MLIAVKFLLELDFLQFQSYLVNFPKSKLMIKLPDYVLRVRILYTKYPY